MMGRAAGEAPRPEVFVEENFAHMDAADTAAVVAALNELGVEAQATEQTTLLKAQWWVLILHWVGDDLPHLGFDSLLTLLGQRVCRHYRIRGTPGPARVDILDANDDVIASLEIEGDDED
jgi:hypothetical protein